MKRVPISTTHTASDPLFRCCAPATRTRSFSSITQPRASSIRVFIKFCTILGILPTPGVWAECPWPVRHARAVASCCATDYVSESPCVCCLLGTLGGRRSDASVSLDCGIRVAALELSRGQLGVVVVDVRPPGHPPQHQVAARHVRVCKTPVRSGGTCREARGTWGL